MKIIKIAVVSIILVGFFGFVARQGGPALSLSTHYESCKSASEEEIALLFEQWNQALQSGDAHKVVALYAERSILLPTVSSKPRLTPDEKEDYFRHFLEDQPSAKIDLRQIEIGCDMAVDSGLYTFIFAKTGEAVKGRYSFTYRWNGSQWLIVSHHSSMMPEAE
jgi:uncharacterized protein (TIGR02246 family)